MYTVESGSRLERMVGKSEQPRRGNPADEGQMSQLLNLSGNSLECVFWGELFTSQHIVKTERFMVTEQRNTGITLLTKDKCK